MPRREPDRRAASLLALVLVTAAALLAAAQATAAAPAAPASVQAQVASAMDRYLDRQGGDRGNLTLRADRLDPRLRLSVCDQALEINEGRPLNLNRGRQTVKVSCHGSSPWRIYVPIELTRRQQAVVAARPLARGDVITAADLSLATVDANRARQRYYTDPRELIGMMATQPLQSGHLVTARDLDINAVVDRGDLVSIQAGTRGFVVGSTGEVQNRAGVGQRVRVKNTRSGKVIEAVVIDSRTVDAIGG
ncbi:flagellar basal body P-ring formation protein FlgA [Guyparkeria hydrothermalis]|uniref:flagellar basal body P-ring formation chaperone FlgA n=1 Tax=Guyparkeria hydrothermalis TaxID=923 RepID=UPI002020E975|nr:flagellar basal body P-ring formation chaperone FlgA [Guyparkeria hydrothermalis]MCL7743432.1 flagellar basal body P-ring formation protein FlgA [Guyparkeria hydrothermalis]